jgi:hypothetical protein
LTLARLWLFSLFLLWRSEIMSDTAIETRVWHLMGQWNTPHGVAEVIEQEGFGIIGGFIDQTGEGNHRLAIAAPELLAQLQRLTDAYAKAMQDSGVTRYPEALAIVRDARAAIAKATK